jgi:hypothetical protein
MAAAIKCLEAVQAGQPVVSQIKVRQEGTWEKPARAQLLQLVVIQVEVGKAAQASQAAAAQVPQLVVAQPQHQQFALDNTNMHDVWFDVFLLTCLTQEQHIASIP